MAFYRCNHGYDKAFGNGTLGNGHITADTTASSFVTYAEDTDVIDLNFVNLTIDSGKTLSADKRNAGMIIRCLGDCTISGSVVNKLPCRTLLDDTFLSNHYPSWLLENGTGGKGGAGQDTTGMTYSPNTYITITGGAGMLGRTYGGGYGGGGAGAAGYMKTSSWTHASYGGYGGSATGITTNTSIFVGGQSAYASGTGNYARNNGAYGGGGSGTSFVGIWSGAGGSGAGGSGGNGSYSSSTYGSGSGGGAGNYGGGVVILLVRGTLYINGAIDCSGSNGGSHGTEVRWGGYGGAGGGGRIYLMSIGTMTRSGTFNVSGGTSGSGDTGKGTDGDRYYINYTNYNRGAGVPTSF